MLQLFCTSKFDFPWMWPIHSKETMSAPVLWDNITYTNETSYPSSFPTYSVNGTNDTSVPTSRPSSFYISDYPTSVPTINPNYTYFPTHPPHAYDIVNDLTNPTKFNFIAMALSLSLLLIIVAVTLYGFFQRYKIVRKKDLISRKYRNTRLSTPERLNMYFLEDVGSTHDMNKFARNIYSLPMHGHMRDSCDSKASVDSNSSYVRLPTTAIVTSPVKVNSV